MSGLLSTTYDARRAFDWSVHPDGGEDNPGERADELSSAIGEFLNASLTEKIRAVLAFHDANGLPPSDAEINEIMNSIRLICGEHP